MSNAGNNMNQFSDEELDRDWKPNGRRPQSTIARSFSAELGDIFRLENSLADLDREVDTRKQKVSREAQELASLEARLKEMEERLKRSGPSRPAIQTDKNQTAEVPPAVPAKGSRPGTARQAQQAPSSGNMPPTPGGSEDGDRE
jgi:chromosome segregation ATPase